MASRNDLTLEKKVNLINENEHGIYYRDLKENFHASLGSVSNIQYQKPKYINDYERKHTKK